MTNDTTPADNLERMLLQWEKSERVGVMLPGTMMTCDEAAAAFRGVLEDAETIVSFSLTEMKAAAGYLRNAKIDLETGATKATATRTIEGGLRRLEAAISRFAVAEEI